MSTDKPTNKPADKPKPEPARKPSNHDRFAMQSSDEMEVWDEETGKWISLEDAVAKAKAKKTKQG
jgi:hypothetical protein